MLRQMIIEKNTMTNTKITILNLILANESAHKTYNNNITEQFNINYNNNPL